ncbi:MAG TPA: hypothetical protein VN684_13210 [Terriglobales bacterium]|nr:hypothetical protein [Terriglobales bacterium]
MISEQTEKVNSSQSANWRYCLRIGGLTLGFTAKGMGVQLDPDHECFRVPSQDCEIEIDLEWVDSLAPADSKKIFDSGAVWTLYEDGEHYVFDFATRVLGPHPYKRLLIDKDFTRGRVLFVRDCFADKANVRALEYPLDELIVINRLARGRGVEVHGCGITDDARLSSLFIGHSGAGKSTTTRLWDSLPGVRILSDDRIIVRKREGSFFMHGTPWHGDAGFASPREAPINQIFVLEHGERNEIVALPQAAAAAELFARCFLPFHDPQALTATLAYLDDLTRTVPCYKFQFLPNHSAVEKILEFQRPR